MTYHKNETNNEIECTYCDEPIQPGEYYYKKSNGDVLCECCAEEV